MSDLLASIVASRHLRPEPVATDALVHLCANSEAASAAMSDLIVELCPGAQPGALKFTGQDIDPDVEGRPDLVGSDVSGTRLVLEAKFDAELTDAQVGGAYLQKLTPGLPGALVFLVPGDRMRNVWRTVTVTPGGASSPLDLPSGALDAGIASLALGQTGHALAVVSWESLLRRLGASAAKYEDFGATAELAQIQGLVAWRTQVGWTPLAPDDLAQRTGRQLEALKDVLKSVCSRVSTAKIRNGTADGGPGRYITTKTGKAIWVGIWFPWWDRYGPGPSWMQVGLKTVQETAVLSEALTNAALGHHMRTEHTDVLVPLLLPWGAELGAVEEALLDQIRAAVSVIDGLAIEVITDESIDDESAIIEPTSR